MSTPADELTELPAASNMQRSIGEAKLGVKAARGRTRLADLYQKANAKIRIPKSSEDALEAVLINTSGGMTGGDRMAWSIEAASGTHAIITTQACEKVYRSNAGVAQVSTNIRVEGDGLVEWLPQETILYDRGGLKRSIAVNLTRDAAFIGLEAVVLGRQAMGEPARQIDFADRWRINRENRIIHADDIKMSGEVKEMLQQPAIMNGKSAFATLVVCLPTSDQIELMVNNMAAACQTTPLWSVNAIGSKIVARFVADNMYELRKTLIPVLYEARQQRALPKVWRT